MHSLGRLAEPQLIESHVGAQHHAVAVAGRAVQLGHLVLAIAAACANGATSMLGVGELRVKESDRLGAMARGLTACGVKIEEDAETLIVHGAGSPPKGGVTIAANLDHRIAMSFLVLGMVSQAAMTIDDASSIDTSFPGFTELMNGLGANIEQGL